MLIYGEAPALAVLDALAEAAIVVEHRTAPAGRWGRGWDALLAMEGDCAGVLDSAATEPAAGITPPLIALCAPGREAEGIALVERGAADYVLLDRLARLPLAIAAARDRTASAKQIHELELSMSVGHEVLRRGFDASTSVLVITDQRGRITSWNRTAERVLGWREAEVRGSRLMELLTVGEDSERLTQAIAEAVATDTPAEERRTLTVRTRDGQPLLRQMRVTRVGSRTTSVIVSLADLADSWRLDLLKERQLGILRALASANDAVALPGVLEQIAMSVDADHAQLWEAGPRGGLRLRSEWPEREGGGAPAPPESVQIPDLVEQAFATGRMAFAEAGGALEADGPGFSLVIPLGHGPQPLGVVEIWGDASPGFDDHLLVLVSAAAEHLATYLVRRRSEMDFARSLDELQRLERERRRLMHLLVDAHEDERRAIAADIHDDPLQSLAAVALRLHTLRRRIDDAGALRTLDQIEDMVRTTVGRLRGMMFNLRPPALDRGDLVGALRERLQQVSEADGLEYQLNAVEPAGLSPDLRASLYRVAQEAVANIVRHASASHIDLTLEEHGGGVLLRVADDGVGIDGGVQAGRPPGMGMDSMRERAELAGGWLRIEPGEAGGTVVNAWVPAQLGEPAGGEAA